MILSGVGIVVILHPISSRRVNAELVIRSIADPLSMKTLIFLDLRLPWMTPVITVAGTIHFGFSAVKDCTFERMSAYFSFRELPEVVLTWLTSIDSEPSQTALLTIRSSPESFSVLMTGTDSFLMGRRQTEKS
jgi:hypothetical protein